MREKIVGWGFAALGLGLSLAIGANLVGPATASNDKDKLVAPSGSVAAEESQVVSPGQELASVDAIDVAEIPTPFSFRRLRPLRTSAGPVDVRKIIEESDFEQVLGVDVRVRLPTLEGAPGWTGRVARIEPIDPDTRAVPIVVAVDGPYGAVVPGDRPPLAKGLFVEVELVSRSILAET